jgi:predicted CopG family antitoxin
VYQDYTVMYMSELTRVPLARETREALKALKRGGESYDAVIRRLMKEAKG